MAYVSQERKKTLVAAAKAAIPKDWKVTFSVRHHSTIVATIQRAPKSVLGDYIGKPEYMSNGQPPVNVYHLDQSYKGATLKTLQKLLAALNTDNFDHSDAMTDFFHVGWYVEISFGRWDKNAEFI